MPHARPLIAATAATVLTAALVITLSGGHSPFAQAMGAAVDQSVAAVDVVDPSAAADAATDAPTADPATSTPTDGATSVASVTSPPAPRPASTSQRAAPPAPPRATPRPTQRPTAPPTIRPTETPEPPERETPAPTLAPGAGSLSVTLVSGRPALAWSTCSATGFRAYAVVRSLDSEIHFPAEDRDTVVAMVTTASTTHLTDTGAPSGVRVWYRVWCLSSSGGESQTIWTTPTVSVTPA